MAKTLIHPAGDRGHVDHGWLNTWHSFSFASWYDPEKVHFGVLRVLNDDWIGPGTGFGKHPHDNMEIITVVLRGALEHKDSMGHTQAITANEVQVMSAGSGIFHSEANHSRTEPVELFQIWIFPETRNVTPRYDQRAFDPAERDNTLQQLVTPMSTDDAGLKIHQSAWISRTRLDAGRSLSLSRHRPENGFYIFVIEGSARAADQDMNRRDAVGVWDTDSVLLEATTDCEILILEIPVTLK